MPLDLHEELPTTVPLLTAGHPTMPLRALAKGTATVIQTMNEAGNTGICYSAYHEIFKRDVVQKTVSLLGLDDAAAYTEPKLLKRLRHRHLAEVWEAQWEPDAKWKDIKAVTFVMPSYAGGSVADALAERHRFSIGDALAIACGVLDALHYLHVDEGLLHRDVKPANVLLDAARRHPYLSDLGSAAAMTGSAQDAEARSGTPLYRPTESRTGRYDARGDIYSAGLLLLECLNGRLPYESLDRDQVDARSPRGSTPSPPACSRPARTSPRRSPGW